MKDYVILTDAAADPAEMSAREYPSVKIIPMSVMIDGKEYTYGKDRSDLTSEEFYSLLRKGSFGSTSSISPGIYLSYFEEYLRQGKDIIYMCFSSGMSSTYMNACMAAGELREEYPDSRITCIDTLNASAAEGFLVHEAAAKKNEGLNYSEMVEWINVNKLKVGAYFSVDTLDNLFRGGRLSKTSAVIGSTLRIKPFLTINREGRLEVIAKTVGMQKALNLLLKKMEDEWNPDAGKYVLICHGDSEERACLLKKKVLENYPEAEVEIGTVGPVIGIHTGPGMISLCFWKRQKENLCLKK